MVLMEFDPSAHKVAIVVDAFVGKNVSMMCREAIDVADELEINIHRVVCCAGTFAVQGYVTSAGKRCGVSTGISSCVAILPHVIMDGYRSQRESNLMLLGRVLDVVEQLRDPLLSISTEDDRIMAVFERCRMDGIRRMEFDEFRGTLSKCEIDRIAVEQTLAVLTRSYPGAWFATQFSSIKECLLEKIAGLAKFFFAKKKQVLQRRKLLVRNRKKRELLRSLRNTCDYHPRHSPSRLRRFPVTMTKFSYSRLNSLCTLPRGRQGLELKRSADDPEGTANAAINKVCLRGSTVVILRYLIDGTPLESHPSYVGVYDPTKIKFERLPPIPISSFEQNRSWGLNLYSSVLNHHGEFVGEIPHAFESGDVIVMTIDMDKGTLNFKVNDSDFGVCCSGLTSPLSPCVSIGGLSESFVVLQEEPPAYELNPRMDMKETDERLLFLVDLESVVHWMDCKIEGCWDVSLIWCSLALLGR